ncbi:hydroxylamine reductase [Thermoanaerobacter brockii subsp. lactiethylicus]|uniref:Hydroxylamine reductase n=2 Tax=Thermoanaerobacter TaxID=1754 RepID=HCP_THEP3|nr:MULTISPECIES: hydroxylamine reductase [Thermoanaerobacter]B0KD48.1 RecName: Full=Hydroxylamine reductase; AltName: Full=Hybrid-cluster protein; Short=HCP; AltName: Full=Prismane protein [Thermoanaerobacter pseudethanolicus ATCC 33223]ABY94146.1 hybrid cluster protein [Thermoanaerobacter pseudethanolicus ATCC 33223]ADV79099.1 hybrid cluster protein [Thermoanaerobacter brockii subsp. finnii Ako-1]MDI3529480.1 hydroxylamine reductase [Thermoanaerobacter sp.]HBW60222.1 hydroxylamine reductase [
MSMFCYQCQEASQGIGCTVRGVCGKTDDVANLQDLLIFTLKGISFLNLKARETGVNKEKTDRFLFEGLFSTITNVNFDRNFFINKIKEAVALREEIKEDLKKAGIEVDESCEAIHWVYDTDEDIEAIAAEVGVLSTKDEDIRSLRELITYGVKGMAAYAYHAYQLGYKDDNIFRFMEKALAKVLDDSLTADDYVALALEAGKYGVDTMALLDKANTSTYGHPEITKVNIGVRNNPGILISGHDLKDLEQLLEQTAGTGVDVYTHGEMLPAHYYPAFKKYPHFVGNYGNAWWQQDREFELFNGPILMTTNCLVPPKDSYKDRVYTTGVVGFEGVKYIPEGPDGKKDFSEIIEHAKRCKPPVEIERGEIIGGFAHNQVLELADKIVEAVKTGAIKRFFVMAGCDGRMKSRTYYTEFAKALPKDTVILTAGCAKYRYNKLNLGDINGIPRVLDAGQCNDSYSLAVIAMKLKEVFGLNDINKLPISYNIAWYEQKAVIVLLALLYLGVKNIHLGPTLPAFLSPNVTKVLVDKFGIGGITNVEDDMKMFMGE